MSGHEHERLSAFLDGELAPAERAAVASHLEACAECQGRLAELHAADAAAATLPSEAPPGYFETFPARVRARLEPRATRRARTLPAWTWAAAAALLLAVVTPLTLLRRPQMGSSAPAREAPAAPSAAVASPPAVSPAPVASRDELAKLAQAPSRPAPPAPETQAPAKREATFAQAPGEADARLPEAAAPQPAPRTRASEAAAAALAPAPAPASPAAAEAEVAALADSVAARDAVGPGARNQATALQEKKVPEESREAVARQEQAAPTAAAATEGLAARGRVAAAPAAAAGSALLTSEAEWRRLDAARPRTADEWRRLRDEWRAFVAHDPAGPQADTARVRGIEAALAAWRASLDPADEAQFRRDAADYLARADARQKERVRALVEAAGTR